MVVDYRRKNRGGAIIAKLTPSVSKTNTVNLEIYSKQIHNLQ